MSNDCFQTAAWIRQKETDWAKTKKQQAHSATGMPKRQYYTE